jgi:hypothetical protein
MSVITYPFIYCGVALLKGVQEKRFDLVSVNSSLTGCTERLSEAEMTAG